MKSTWIVVPCYNEANRLERKPFETFLAANQHCGFTFVDDGSKDETAQMIQQWQAKHPDAVQLVRLDTNQGKAAAVREGILHSLTLQPETFGYWDADLATPLDAIPEFESRLRSNNEIQMVFGSRVRLLGRQIQRDPFRHYAGRVFATAASWLLQLPIYDTQCGAKLFRSTAQTRQLFADPFLTNWIFDVEIIARARQQLSLDQLKQAIYEHPLTTWQDIKGSKVRTGDFAKAAIELNRIRRAYLRNRQS